MDKFRKTRSTLWRDHLLAIGLLLLGLRILSASFHEGGHDAVCLVLQVSAGAVLLAAVGLSIAWLSEPILQIDKIGIAENGFLFKSYNWSMKWNEIARAQVSGLTHNRLLLFGMENPEPDHVIYGYEQFEQILTRVRGGLKRFGRAVNSASGLHFLSS